MTDDTNARSRSYVERDLSPEAKLAMQKYLFKWISSATAIIVALGAIGLWSALSSIRTEIIKNVQTSVNATLDPVKQRLTQAQEDAFRRIVEADTLAKQAIRQAQNLLDSSEKLGKQIEDALDKAESAAKLSFSAVGNVKIATNQYNEVTRNLKEIENIASDLDETVRTTTQTALDVSNRVALLAEDTNLRVDEIDVELSAIVDRAKIKEDKVNLVTGQLKNAADELEASTLSLANQRTNLELAIEIAVEAELAKSEISQMVIEVVQKDELIIETIAQSAAKHIFGDKIEIDTNQGSLFLTGDLRVGEESAIGNVHLLLADEFKSLWAGKGGEHVANVADFVGSAAKGAVLNVVVRSPSGFGTKGDAAFVCSDRNGKFAELGFYAHNGVTTGAGDLVGGVVFCPFFEGGKFRWKTLSQENKGKPDSATKSYATLIGWF